MFNYFTLITLFPSKLVSRNWHLPSVFYFYVFCALAKLRFLVFFTFTLDLINVFYNFPTCTYVCVNAHTLRGLVHARATLALGFVGSILR